MTHKTGSLFIISAPSGAGKTSLVKALIESTDGIAVSISHTTRAMRPGEEDGVHYHFVDQARFKSMISNHDFLEHAQVFDNFYGTSKSGVADQQSGGTDVILEIDWQGAQQVRQLIPEALSIFILPPSTAALKERLTGRGQDSDEIINRRLQDAVSDMHHYHEFNYTIINDDFDTALDELRSIFIANRLLTARQQQNREAQLKNLLA